MNETFWHITAHLQLELFQNWFRWTCPLISMSAALRRRKRPLNWTHRMFSTVLMTQIHGYWKHVNSAFVPLSKHQHLKKKKKFLSVFWSRLCSNQHQGVIIGHIRLATLLQGSPIGGQDYEALTVPYWSPPRLLVQRYLLNGSSWVWVQTAQLCPPFSYMYSLPHLVSSAHCII